MYKIIFLTSLISLFGCNGQKRSEKLNDSKPNVVIIFTDDQGYEDVGVFGSPNIETPNLNLLAKNGLKLTSFYSAQAVCSASRAGLLTGCYPNRLGIHGAFMPDSKKGLNLSETTLAEMLKNVGYHTAIFGKWHLGDHPDFMPLNQGFDEYYGIPYSNDMWPKHPQQGPVFNFGPLPLYENQTIIDTIEDQSFLTTEITKRSVDFINRNKENPFFLYVAHPQPHVPLHVSDKFKGKSARGLYGDVIMEIDWSVGEIKKALKENGIDENTMIIYTSDNGPWLSYGDHAGSAGPFREGKGTAFEGGHRVPAIIEYPGVLEGGKAIDVPMMNIDILPTIAEITNTNLPEKKIDGKSVWSIWTGEKESSVQDAYFFYYNVNQLQGVRYKNWKLYFPHGYATLNGKDGGKDGLPEPYDVEHFKEIQLYDLAKDIGETKNVAAEFPQVVDTIKQLADKKRQEIGDKLLDMEGSESRSIGLVE